MSPYMKAYQAGIKLAEHEFFSKIADPENVPTESNSETPVEDLQQEAGQLAALMNNPDLDDKSKQRVADKYTSVINELGCWCGRITILLILRYELEWN